MTEARPFLRRVSDFLSLPFPQWAMAFVLAAVSLYFLTRTLGAPAIWGILAVLTIVGVVSELASRFQTKATAEDATEALIRVVDEYCAQLQSRRAQRPWLLACLVAYLCTFLLFIYGYADGQLKSREWIDLLVVATIAIGSMLRVGVLSEDNPPDVGAEKMLPALYEYRRYALCASRYQDLMAKLQSGCWQMEDLVNFATAEDQDNRRRKLKRQRLVHKN